MSRTSRLLDDQQKEIGCNLTSLDRRNVPQTLMTDNENIFPSDDGLGHVDLVESENIPNRKKIDGFESQTRPRVSC